MIRHKHLMFPLKGDKNLLKLQHLESLYTNINKHHSLLGYNISPFGTTDELFLPV